MNIEQKIKSMERKANMLLVAYWVARFAMVSSLGFLLYYFFTLMIQYSFETNLLVFILSIIGIYWIDRVASFYWGYHVIVWNDLRRFKEKHGRT